MRIIEPQVEIYRETDHLRKIEHIARVCTGTQDKAGSKPGFVEKLIERGHTSVLEHVRVACPPPNTIKIERNNIYGFGNRLGITCPDGRILGVDHCWTMNARDFLAIGGTLSELADLPEADDYMTVKFTVDIGISRELIRHRQMSFTERSTRYFNMADGIEFVRPLPFEWANEEWEDVTAGEAFDVATKNLKWQWVCSGAEEKYKEMIDAGCTPQEARTVLPLSTATRLYVTGTFKQWGDLLKLRLGKGAHPSMRYAMRLMLENPDCPLPIKNWETLTNE